MVEDAAARAALRSCLCAEDAQHQFPKTGGFKA